MNDETLFEFPCEFPIKMMGRHTPKFRDMAISIIEKHAGPLSDNAIQSSLSKNGRFISITITVDAQSKQQLDDIYQDVIDHEDVLMAL